MDHMLNIEEKSQGSEVYARLDQFRNKRQYCDFTIKCGAEVIHVHKCVIAATSDYFNAMLSHPTIENQKKVVEIKEVDPQCIKKCVDFMYTGKSAISKYKVCDMIHAARLLQLQKLCDRINQYLKTTLDSDSFFTIRKIANIYGLDTLIEACNKFAIDNMYDIMKDEEFRDLEAEVLKSILLTPSYITMEDIKCKALMVWVNNDTNRGERLFEFMQLIDIKNVRLSYRKFLLNHPIIFNKPRCLQYITNSIPDESTVEADDFTGLGQVGVLVITDKKVMLVDLKKNVLSELCLYKEGCRGVVVVGEYVYLLTFEQGLCRLDISKKNAKFENLAMPPQLYEDEVIRGDLAVLNGMLYVWHPHKLGQYDLAADRWSEIDHEYARHPECTTVAHGKLIFIGLNYYGPNDDDEEYYGVKCFDPIALTWRSLDSMRIYPYLPSACTHENVIYVFGIWCDAYEYAGYGVHILTSLDGQWELVNLLLPGDIEWTEDYICNSFNGGIFLVGQRTSEDHDRGKPTHSVTMSVFNPELKCVSELAVVPGLASFYDFYFAMFQLN